jgi:hypothetical protein
MPMDQFHQRPLRQVSHPNISVVVDFWNEPLIIWELHPMVASVCEICSLMSAYRSQLRQNTVLRTYMYLDLVYHLILQQMYFH